MTLKDKWGLLEKETKSAGIKTLRYQSTGPLELFLALDEDNCRSVIINLPRDCKPRLTEKINANLELVFFKDSHILLVRLIDNEYQDLFDDLAVSLFNSMRYTQDPHQAADIFVQTYIKWSSLFTAQKTTKLRTERIIGLWGELNYLSKLLETCTNASAIERALKYWVGPYDAPHDFEFQTFSIELKTKSINTNSIKISSEFQLQSLVDKELYLVVFSIEERSDGNSLNDLFLRCKELICDKGGDLSHLLMPFARLNLSEEVLKDYDNYKLKLTMKQTYLCTNESFPSIRASSLPNGISNVRYSLDCSELHDFLVEMESY